MTYGFAGYHEPEYNHSAACEKRELRKQYMTDKQFIRMQNREVAILAECERQRKQIEMEKRFVNGIKLETKENQFGSEYIKASIDLEALKENPINNDKWINFMIFKSKSGNWYTQICQKQEAKNE